MINLYINIKFNLNNLLINCDREEIQGIIYNEINENKKLGKKIMRQEFQDLVLKKISLTLPMDLILPKMILCDTLILQYTYTQLLIALIYLFHHKKRFCHF